MKKQVSSKYTQLTINFEFESTTPAPAEQPNNQEVEYENFGDEVCKRFYQDGG